jgi:hypothetical protein
MSSNPRLEAALEFLRASNHKVGPAQVEDGEIFFEIDGVPRTFAEIFQMIEDHIKSRRAEA